MSGLGEARLGLVTTTLALLALTACSGSKQDQYRTVTAYEFASCDSVPTTDPVQIEALHRFRDRATGHWFRNGGKSLFAAMHERNGAESGVREYRGVPYWYLHVLKLEPEEAASGVEWKAMAYLHVREVRTRVNGGEWGEWQRVHTRNFGASNAGPTAEGLGRWACLVGAEVAWAEVLRVKSESGAEWQVKPLGAGPYTEGELHRLEPLPTQGQAAGRESVPAGAP